MWKDILQSENKEEVKCIKIDPIPQICNKFKNDKRKCQIPNFIPRQVQYNNYIGWKEAYLNHLINMFNITMNIIDTDDKNSNNFENFCKMIYYCSSKYITKYI